MQYNNNNNININNNNNKKNKFSRGYLKVIFSQINFFLCVFNVIYKTSSI